MKSVLFCVLALVCGTLCAQECGPGGCVDQAAATQKIEYMVQNNIINRHVGPMIGRFEGIGYSTSPNNIRTCTPRQPMTLTADVVRRTRDGMYLRIRIWR
jgi:hypothetical protein